jgi:hypothetical protein
VRFSAFSGLAGLAIDFGVVLNMIVKVLTL